MAYPAQGAVVDSGPGFTVRHLYSVDPANAASVQSTWANIGSDGLSGVLQLEGYATTTCAPVIRGYMGATPPTAATAGYVISGLATLTADGLYAVNNPPQWISVGMPANTTTANTLQVFHLGRRNSFR